MVFKLYLMREGIVPLVRKNYVCTCKCSPPLTQYSTVKTQSADLFFLKSLPVFWPTLCMLIPIPTLSSQYPPYTFIFSFKETLHIANQSCQNTPSTMPVPHQEALSPNGEALLAVLLMVIASVFKLRVLGFTPWNLIVNSKLLPSTIYQSHLPICPFKTSQ